MKQIKQGVTFKSGRWTLRINAARNGALVVDVENPRGTWSDRSICYETSQVAYDFPERIPQTVKDRVSQLYRRMR